MAIANYLPRTRQWEINTLIDEILLITGRTYPESSLLDIIKSYIPGVAVIQHDFDSDLSVRGAIYKRSTEFERPIIAIQKNQSKGAKTFTLAHEFGHYCLDHVGGSNYMIDKESYDGSDHMQREAEAQYFAASLLMPVEHFTRLSNYLTNAQLAKRFGVTEAAVRVRRRWLDGENQAGSHL